MKRGYIIIDNGSGRILRSQNEVQAMTYLFAHNTNGAEIERRVVELTSMDRIGDKVFHDIIQEWCDDMPAHTALYRETAYLHLVAQNEAMLPNTVVHALDVLSKTDCGDTALDACAGDDFLEDVLRACPEFRALPYAGTDDCDGFHDDDDVMAALDGIAFLFAAEAGQTEIADELAKTVFRDHPL